MIKLIVTASDKLYQVLSEKARAEGHVPQRAHDVLRGFEQAARLGKAQADTASLHPQHQDRLSGIVVDMSLRAADTLLETLHSRQYTSGIPLVAVKCDGEVLPLALRRLCTEVLETDGGGALDEKRMGEP
jgi:hypothetical protein